MYRIKNKTTNRIVIKNVFSTYEEARLAARRYLRKLRAKGKLGSAAHTGMFGYWDKISRNPTKLGFLKIARVS